MLKALKQYLPFFGMVLVAVLQAAQIALEDNAVSADDVFVLALAFLGAVTTYVVPRLPGALQWLKTAVAAVVAVVTALSTAYVGGVSMQELVNIALAVLGTAGVAASTRFVPTTAPVRDNVVEGPVVTDLESGESTVGLAVGVLVLVILVLVIIRLV